MRRWLPSPVLPCIKRSRHEDHARAKAALALPRDEHRRTLNPPEPKAALSPSSAWVNLISVHLRTVPREMRRVMVAAGHCLLPRSGAARVA